MAFINYYIVLGIKNTASFEEIKAAFRALAKKYHPDRNPNNKAAEDFFKLAQEAYSVLSHPEKRKKYDLKFNYSSQQNFKGYTTYTGNAYQYAQQEAQYKKKQQQNNSTKKHGTKKPDKSEKIQIVASVGIALILLNFIISYSSGSSQQPNEKTFTKKEIDELVQLTLTENKITPKEEEPADIISFESPYSDFFGKEINDMDNMNNIVIHNSYVCEAIVCLVDVETNRVIRNQYIDRESTFKFNTIPDGIYFLKVYYGTNWSSKKIMNNSIKGGFKDELGYVELNSGKHEVYKMKQHRQGASTAYSSYEVNLDPYRQQNVKVITESEFFSNNQP